MVIALVSLSARIATVAPSVARATLGNKSVMSAYLNGKIYRIGGRGLGRTDDHMEVYTIASNSWSMAANLPGSMQLLNAVALGDYVYITAGNGSRSTLRYDPATNTWDDAAIADLPLCLYSLRRVRRADLSARRGPHGGPYT